MARAVSDGMVGDINANVEKLKGYLRQARFPVHRLDMEGLRAGKASAVLPILHYIFLGFSVLFSRFLSEKGHELHAKSDLRFLESAYKALRENLGYSPALSTAQFFSNGFAERKVLLCQDVMQLARRKHSELMGSSKPKLHRRPERHAGADMASQILADDAQPHLELQPALGTWESCSVLRDSLEVLAQPQTPPKPCPLEMTQETVPEIDATVRFQETYIATADIPRHFPSGLSTPLPTAEFESLRELLEGIRAALNRRFDTLERRFEEYVEQADARTALLQGEVKILTSRLQEAAFSQEKVKDQSDALASHVSVTGTSVFGPSVQPHAASLQQKDLQTSLQKFWPSSAGLRVGSGSVQLLSQIPPGLEVSTGGPSGDAAAVPARTGESWSRLQEHAKSEFVDRDTHALIEQLSCKFRDTQELINKAQEKMQQVGINTQGVTDGLRPCCGALQSKQGDCHQDVKSRSSTEDKGMVGVASMQLQREERLEEWHATSAHPSSFAETLLG